MNIRIVSYNLWFNKAYPELLGIVQSQKPDVICLQECYPTELEDDLDSLTLAGGHRYVHRLPIKHRQTKNRISPGVLGGDVGMAIYYNPRRLELERMEHLELPLPWQERKGGRIVQAARFKVVATEKRFVVVNVHLSALLVPNGVRRRQILEVLEWIVKHEKGNPVIFAGDFNYPVAPRGLRALMEKEGFVECGTHTPKPTHVSKLVKGKFDRIFISSDLTEREYTILPFGISDHAPVSAAIDFASSTFE